MEKRDLINALRKSANVSNAGVPPLCKSSSTPGIPGFRDGIPGTVYPGFRGQYIYLFLFSFSSRLLRFQASARFMFQCIPKRCTSQRPACS